MMKSHKYIDLTFAAGLLIFLIGCGRIPSSTPTPSPAAPATVPASPFAAFTGSVQVEGGACCIGGTMGQTVQAHVQFTAASTSGRVDRMRVMPGSRCATETDLGAIPWEPFAESRDYPVAVALNWVGFYVSAQFQDQQGHISPVYCDDISVEGMPPPILVNPTEWYPQIRCFSGSDVHPGPAEVVTGPEVTFSWPEEKDLPSGVFYSVSAFSGVDNYAGLAAGGMTRETSITLPIAPGRSGDMVWYLTLVDANGTFLDHGKCSSFPASLLSVDPPEGIKGIHFTYRP